MICIRQLRAHGQISQLVRVLADPRILKVKPVGMMIMILVIVVTEIASGQARSQLRVGKGQIRRQAFRLEEGAVRGGRKGGRQAIVGGSIVLQ